MSFKPRMERLQEFCAVLGWGEYKGDIQSWAGATTGVLFSLRMERLQWCHLDLGWGEYKSVVHS